MAKILKGTEYKDRLNLKARIEAEIPATMTKPLELEGVLDQEVLAAQGKAKEILNAAKENALKIKQEAKEILEQVKVEMERSQAEAAQKGYQEGLEKGLEMLVRVKELRAKLFDDNEKELIKLVFEIAKKIIGREFKENNKAVMNVIRLALSDAVGEKITVRLNPQDYENIKENQSELLKAVDEGVTISLREDEEIEAGGCLVDTEIGSIDAQLATQLNAIKKALGL